MTAEQSPSLEEGLVIDDKWEIQSHIATGGKGEVYLARQVNLDRPVALKIISSSFLETLGEDTEEIGAELERFRREVRIMAKTRHQNVLQVYDYGKVTHEEKDLRYIVMEYVPGPTLKLTMEEQGFGGDEEAITRWLQRYFIPVLHGVEAIHSKGIIHRDLKPANVLLDDDIPKIADFGLAGGVAATESITRSHHIIGTMPYMPEEQFMDLATTDARADVFSLGRILYEAVIGKLTKENSPPFKTVGLTDPATPYMQELDRIIRKATAHDRNNRIPTVRALREAVQCLVDKHCAVTESPTGTITTAKSSSTSWIFLTGLFVALLGAGLLYHFFGMEDSAPPPQPIETEAVSPETGREPKRKATAPETEPPPRTDTQAAGEHPPLQEKAPGSSAVVLKNSDGTYKRSIRGGDGATLMLVQDGEALFYMDETEVTNHQFTTFLHSVNGITTRDNAVYKDDEIWLYLGEVELGYEPYQLEDEKITIKTSAVLNPVVRVTPLGAQAFAHHFGRRLPTMEEWLTAKRLGEESKTQSSRPFPSPGIRYASMGQMHSPSTEPEPRSVPSSPPPAVAPAPKTKIYPVEMSPPNALGIRGLGKNAAEWVIKPLLDGQVEFHVHGGSGDTDEYLIRNPWEAFSNVGFRTVLPVSPGP